MAAWILAVARGVEQGAAWWLAREERGIVGENRGSGAIFFSYRIEEGALISERKIRPVVFAN
jgi:hypothetical protein